MVAAHGPNAFFARTPASAVRVPGSAWAPGAHHTGGQAATGPRECQVHHGSLTNRSQQGRFPQPPHGPGDSPLPLHLAHTSSPADKWGWRNCTALCLVVSQHLPAACMLGNVLVYYMNGLLSVGSRKAKFFVYLIQSQRAWHTVGTQ